MVEKGIVGLGLYLFLLIAIVQSLWERRKERESRVVFCLLSALAIKEMTQASLLGTHFALFLLAISLVFPQGDENGSVEKTETVSVWDYGLPVVVLLCYFVYVGFVFRKEREDQRLRAIESAWKRGEWGEALRLMERAGERTPDLVNRALLYGRAYRETGDIMHLADAEKALREARRRQPEDVQIEYLWTCLYLDKRESGKAADIAGRLASAYPRNAFYRFAWAEALYRQGEKEAALAELVEAIRFMPRLLTEEKIDVLRLSDPGFYRALERRLSDLHTSLEDTPADYARYGYIVHRLGDRPRAERYLRRAVEGLPNLATPWRLLGDTAKYRLLLYGAFQKDLRATEIPEDTAITASRLFLRYYPFKFTQWYGQRLLFSE